MEDVSRRRFIQGSITYLRKPFHLSCPVLCQITPVMDDHMPAPLSFSQSFPMTSHQFSPVQISQQFRHSLAPIVHSSTIMVLSFFLSFPAKYFTGGLT